MVLFRHLTGHTYFGQNPIEQSLTSNKKKNKDTQVSVKQSKVSLNSAERG
jgi:hypothetical protein